MRPLAIQKTVLCLLAAGLVLPYWWLTPNGETAGAPTTLKSFEIQTGQESVQIRLNTDTQTQVSTEATDGSYTVVLHNTKLSEEQIQNGLPVVMDNQSRFIGRAVPAENNKVKIILPNIPTKQYQVSVVQTGGGKTQTVVAAPPPVQSIEKRTIAKQTPQVDWNQVRLKPAADPLSSQFEPMARQLGEGSIVIGSSQVTPRTAARQGARSSARHALQPKQNGILRLKPDPQAEALAYGGASELGQSALSQAILRQYGGNTREPVKPEIRSSNRPVKVASNAKKPSIRQASKVKLPAETLIPTNQLLPEDGTIVIGNDTFSSRSTANAPVVFERNPAMSRSKAAFFGEDVQQSNAQGQSVAALGKARQRTAQSMGFGFQPSRKPVVASSEIKQAVIPNQPSKPLHNLFARPTQRGAEPAYPPPTSSTSSQVVSALPEKPQSEGLISNADPALNQTVTTQETTQPLPGGPEASVVPEATNALALSESISSGTSEGIPASSNHNQLQKMIMMGLVGIAILSGMLGMFLLMSRSSQPSRQPSSQPKGTSGLPLVPRMNQSGYAMAPVSTTLSIESQLPQTPTVFHTPSRFGGLEMARTPQAPSLQSGLQTALPTFPTAASLKAANSLLQAKRAAELAVEEAQEEDLIESANFLLSPPKTVTEAVQHSFSLHYA